MRTKIDTNYGWLRVVETRPFSYEWSNRYQTALALMVKPLKTRLDSMVRPLFLWLTMSLFPHFHTMRELAKELKSE